MAATGVDNYLTPWARPIGYIKCYRLSTTRPIKSPNCDSVLDPPILITIEMLVKAIIKMKNGKAAGPSGIIAEMLKTSSDTGVWLVTDLPNDMIRNGSI